MNDKQPVRPHFDARVGFFPRRGRPMGVYGVIKVTYDISELPRVIEAIPLTADVLHPEVEPRLDLGGDFWLDKRSTDVVVLGAAHHRTPTAEMQISVSVGDFERRIVVIGSRSATMTAGRVVFTDPEEFTEMPVTWSRAYGGVDHGVPVEEPPSEDLRTLMRDHPGLYPRNPFGKGYLVKEPSEGVRVELPNLEDPDDRLTPERFVVRDPRRWWLQPLPATFHYAPYPIFMRYVYLGADAWFSPPDDATLPEVQRGILPAGFRSLFRHGIDAGYFQEAAPGLALPQPSPGTPIAVRGMHPGGDIVHASLPEPPPVELDLEGRRQTPVLHLNKLVLIPAKHKLVTTWVAKTSDMHRIFLPGTHAKIPLRLRVGTDDWIPYQVPKTLRQAADEAERNGMDLSAPRPRRPRARSGQ